MGEKKQAETVVLPRRTLDKIPILFVDVNMGGGRVQRIVIYEGDTPEALAEKFALENSKNKFSFDKIGRFTREYEE